MDFEKHNTRIGYLYRDASNYKVYNQCVIEGLLSNAQREKIIKSCDEGTYFIPSLVGLPEERFDAITEDDHPYFELDDYSFSDTSSAATVTISATELVAKFLEYAGRWEKFAAAAFCGAQYPTKLKN